MAESELATGLKNEPIEHVISNTFSSEPVETISSSFENSETLIENPVEMPEESAKKPIENNNENNLEEKEEAESLSTFESNGQSTEDEWLDIMGSGNFKKKIIEPGLGHETRPTKGDVVTVNYKFYFNNTIFEEKDNFKFIVGDLDVIQGIDLVVCLMEKGEKAKVLIPPQLAFGKQGSPPIVPENADIECDIELKEAEMLKDDSLTATERLNLGNEKRLRGNHFYERGDYLESIHCYERAVEYLDGVRDCTNISKEESQEIVDVRIKVYNNMAASHLKLGAHDSALSSVELVLKVQPQNVKALFRKAKILGEKGSTEDAIACIRLAAKLEPETKAIQKELTKLLTKKKREEDSQRAMYQRMFPPSDTKKSSSFSKTFKWSMVAGGGVLALAVGMAAYRNSSTRLFSFLY